MLHDSKSAMATYDDVGNAYRFFLRREPDAGGHAAYADRVDRGDLTFDRLVHEFSGCVEHRIHMGPHDPRIEIHRCFRAVYEREPTAQEIEHIANVACRIGATGDRGLMRATVVAFSRTDYPTPVSVRFTGAELVETPIAGSASKLTLDRADLSVSEPIIHGQAYEPHLGRVLPLFLKRGMTAVDVGANVGFHTLKFSELVGPTGRVFAFEPNTENCRMLLLTKARCQIKNTDIIPVALSDRTGSALFSPAIGSNGGFLSETMETLLHPNCMVVPTVRLDDIIQPDRLDFIKIDVEGAEALVLRGGRRLIEKHRPVIFAEFSRDMASRVSRVDGPDYLAAMAQRSYRIYTLGLSGPVTQVTDIEAFFAAWGDLYRIEDFAFVPAENDPGLDAIKQGAFAPAKSAGRFSRVWRAAADHRANRADNDEMATACA